ncbi:MAG: N-6 DNA methylase [Anaerolineae bacterium]|jgi:adenine-specific DNA-methyltransferase
MVISAVKAELAAYYTPPAIATVLTDWAVTSTECSVFDPSFGGCAFIYGALASLQRLGASRPGQQIYGVDIDGDAQQHLKPVLDAGGSLSQFPVADFFSLPRNRPPWTEFDAIVGNPPYIRHHSLSHQQRDAAVKAVESIGAKLSGRSSYWAYFAVYAMSFLKPGGRMALVLPGAFLHADYAAPVRQAITDSFGEVSIILLQDRVFDNTDEESVIVCGTDAHLAPRRLRIGSVSSLEQLRGALERPDQHLRTWSASGQTSYLSAIVPPEALDVLQRMRKGGEAVLAGNWVHARIGVVTGSNDFFVRSHNDLERDGIPIGYSRPILRRSSHAKGLFATDERLGAFYGSTGRSRLLVLPPDEALPTRLQDYVEHGNTLGLCHRAKCRAREPWYSLPVPAIPPAFLSAMTADWPRIIINQSQYACTNNIYHLEWLRERDDSDWVRLALGSLSSASQLSAELVGRSYGGGVLKLEPREFAGWVIPVLPIDVAREIAPEVDAALFLSNKQLATEIVDAAIVQSMRLCGVADLESIRVARDLLRCRRRPAPRVKEQNTVVPRRNARSA